MRGKKVPDNVKEKIVERLINGATRSEVAKEFNLGREKVADIAKDYGVTNWMDEDFKEWFIAEWANIYPGDQKRRLMTGKRSAAAVIPKKSEDYKNENNREFYARFAERWGNIYPGNEVRRAMADERWNNY